ncbi:polyamine transporter tpo5 [Vanrija albida]|uniref:Polyamine transporter tpo5 n=1 Tax=Vanrija albida TaxID=181172 RepID=A0ABR3Q3P2_9TREE
MSFQAINRRLSTAKQGDKVVAAPTSEASSDYEDRMELEKQGYKQEFLREFGNIATFSFAFSIMGVSSSIAVTFSTPMLTGGPASVIWCWLIGAIFSCFIGTAIAELVSAYPTSGALYTASARLVPPRHRIWVGYIIGWMNVLGNIAGAASTEFGLAQMIWAAYGASRGEAGYEPSAGQVVGLFVGLLLIHGLFNSLRTKQLAFVTQYFAFINIGVLLCTVIAVLAKTPRHEIHSANYSFTYLENQSGWSNSGLSFLLGLLSVQWTMTGYDATAHITEEVKRAAVAAPVAIFLAVISTGILGWVLNIVMVLVSGPLADLPGSTGNAYLAILILRLGRTGALVVWSFTILISFFTLQTGLQGSCIHPRTVLTLANARALFAFSRDNGLPDGKLLGQINPYTKTPINAVWCVVILSVALGCLDFASPIAAEAVFSLATVALDLSYGLPIFFRMIFAGYEGVDFKPGPFYMGDGWLSKAINWIAVVYIVFECVILSIPAVYPVTKDTMNYAGPITIGVMLLGGVWFLLYARRHYFGPAEMVEFPLDSHPAEESDENSHEKA